MNLLLTGASGGLGKRLIPALLAREKVRIRVLVHRTPVEFPECEQVQGALEDLDSLTEATSGIDTVLHLAALTHSTKVDDYFQVNVEGTKNLLDACRRNKVRRFIFMSSGAAHPRGGGYSESKLAAENVVKHSTLPWLILRPREVYGAGGKEGIDQLIAWVRKYPVIPVIGKGKYSLSPVCIEDVISATVEAVFREGLTGESFALAGPEELAFTALIDRLCEFFKVRAGKIFLPVPLMAAVIRILNALTIKTPVPDQIPRLLCDKSSSKESDIPSLNYHPRKLEEGLRQCFPEKD